MARIGIITAMPTEVWPLIRTWLVRRRGHGGRNFRFFESEGAIALPGGIGHQAGLRAASAMLELYQPETLVAAGLAGGLTPHWTLGRTLLAAEVIDSATGAHYRTAAGEGVVVSSRVIAGAAEKLRLHCEFPEADAVDMEGAAVAEIANRSGVRFLAAKAISDNLEFDLPPLNGFVDAEGRFCSGRFVLSAFAHPKWWAKIVQLKRISDVGAQHLTRLLNQVIKSEVPALRDRISTGTPNTKS
ncbi:MAG: hypothetical protein JO041_04265 [Acidobacteria bacterium]|nr:hypothetical protein [Acidobacteriota bacterium]